jgi:predicted dehydrogenase
MQELAAAIREGRRPSRGATFVDGLANQRLLDAVRLSGTERRWVRPEDIDATA